MQKKKVVSGMRPTGRLHLGNYWGALKNWVDIQDKYDCSFFVADWHALTTGHEDTVNLKENTRQMVIDWLAAGLDPQKCVIFQQSQVSEHAELSLLLGMITPLGWLLRNPTYKEQLVELYKKRYAGQEHAAANNAPGKHLQVLTDALNVGSEQEVAALADFSSFGFLGYPVLMATDILVQGGELVPVGQDQVAHIEITREIARRFAEFYGKGIIVEPQPLLTSSPKVPGLDGRKMSKSYNNAIEIGEDPASVEKKIMRMFTDPNKKRANDKGNPDGCVVFALHKIYNSDNAKVCEDCKQGAIGCVSCKKSLFSLMSPSLEQFRAKRKEYENNPALVDDVLAKGSLKAKERAAVILESVRKAMHLK